MDVKIKVSGLKLKTVTLDGEAVKLKGGKTGTMKNLNCNQKYHLYWYFEGEAGESTEVGLTPTEGTLQGNFPASTTIPVDEKAAHEKRWFKVVC